MKSAVLIVWWFSVCNLRAVGLGWGQGARPTPLPSLVTSNVVGQEKCFNVVKEFIQWFLNPERTGFAGRS
jgi:hypothetical protein